MKKTLLASFAFLALSGCLSPVKSVPDTTYLLTEASSYEAPMPMRPVTLLVLMPESTPFLNTTAMAYTLQPYQIAYFVKNRWAETPSQMLLPLLVQSLQNTHRFRTIVAPPFLGVYQYMLSTQILQLQQNFMYQPARIQMTLRMQLSSATGRVITTRVLMVEEPILGKTTYNGVIAANNATERMLTKIAKVCVESLR